MDVDIMYEVEMDHDLWAWQREQQEIIELGIVCGWTYELGLGMVFGWAYEVKLELGMLFGWACGVNLAISCGLVRYSRVD